MRYLRFVDQGSKQVLEPPGILGRTRLYVFLLEGCRRRLRVLCDRELNTDPSGRVRYTPFGHHVALILAEIGSLGSADPRRGSFQYRDFGVWIPLLTRSGRLRMYPPYIFVDDGSVMITGRAVYGLPKELARLGMPASPDRLEAFTADVVGFEAESPGALNDWHRLFEVKGPCSDGSLLAAEIPGWLAAAAESLASRLASAGSHVGLDLSTLGPGFTMLGVRQLPDPARPHLASHRSIVEAPIRAVHVHGGGLLRRGFDFELHALASHPLADDLGLCSQAIDLAFYMEADLHVGLGREVGRGGGSPPSAPGPTPSSSAAKAGVESAAARTKIAILGGGMGALSTAFWLTQTPELRARYEITIYEMGFRLGGKAASSRNAQIYDRIEEDGLHVWYGFYENAFRTVRACYAENEPHAPAKLKRWEDAFIPRNTLLLSECYGGEWFKWSLVSPRNELVPGDGNELPLVWNAAAIALDWILEAAEELPGRFVRGTFSAMDSLLPSWGRLHARLTERRAELRASKGLEQELSGWSGGLLDQDDVRRPAWPVPGPHKLLLFARNLAKRLASLVRSGEREQESSLLADFGPSASLTLLAEVLRSVRRAIRGWARRHEGDPLVRKLWQMLDTMTAIVTGLVECHLWGGDLGRIDHLDFSEWLRRYVDDPRTVDCGPPVRAIYSAAFAFEGGRTDRPNLAAGVALRAILRMFAYKTALVFHLNPTMGDAVIAPLYAVLKRRGVKFDFFHRVERLGLSEGASSVASIMLTRQAELTPAARASGYDPLVVVKGLPCWPGQPDYSQLERGEALRASAIDFDDPRADAPGASRLTLRAGVDFDKVVLAIPVAALEPLCGELAAAEPRWARMLAGIRTVRTQSFQVWMSVHLARLGLQSPGVILGTYVQPIDTYSDMSHTIEHESWPPGQVSSVGYFCGVLDDRGLTSPEQALDQVRRNAHHYLLHESSFFWPGVRAEAVFDIFVAPPEHVGEARLDDQYFHVSYHPWQRYTLSVKGSTQYRMKPGDSGFENLYLAGDWTDNGLSMGAVEAAVMSGMQASREICGSPEIVSGEDDASLWGH